MAQFIASVFQQAFFDWIVKGTGSCVLQAVAGSGKTTTLLHALRLMIGTIFFGAYNKKIAEEIKARAGNVEGLTVSTMHAAGFAAWRNAVRNSSLKIDGNKCRDIFRADVLNCATVEDNEYRAMVEGAVISLVSYAKQAAVGVLSDASDYSVWSAMIEHFNIDTLERDAEVIDMAQYVLSVSNDVGNTLIDFDDMIYLPLFFKVRFPEYDWVLIDEAQDTNASRRALALSMLKRGGRLVAVGDKHQAIYGFTGADSDALDLIRDAVSAIELPLTVSYRCPKSVVKYAQSFVSHIEAAPEAIEGSVTHLPEDNDLSLSVKPGDAIICRFNLPLLSACYQFIAKGIPAKVEGRDIAAGLKKLANRWKVSSLQALSNKLDSYLDKEVAKYRAKEQESKAAAVEDTVACLRIIIDRCKTNGKTINSEIDSIFGEDISAACVTLCSGHKSKGREWDNVLWLTTGASPWARKDWEIEQENNIDYVITTRAKVNLMLQPVPVKKKANPG